MKNIIDVGRGLIYKPGKNLPCGWIKVDFIIQNHLMLIVLDQFDDTITMYC